MKVALALVGTFLAAFGLAVLDGGWPPSQERELELSCGAFPPTLTEADLVARFGSENVTTGSFTGEDDGPIDGTVVFADDSTKRFELRWTDEARRVPAWIRVRGAQSRWRTSRDVTVGMDLKALERLNRVPFRLNGFAMELSGRVKSWSGGRLEIAPTPGCELGVDLGLKYDGTEHISLTRQVSGRREYSSGHPAMQALEPRVVELVLTYELSPMSPGS